MYISMFLLLLGGFLFYVIDVCFCLVMGVLFICLEFCLFIVCQPSKTCSRHIYVCKPICQRHHTQESLTGLKAVCFHLLAFVD